MQRQKNYGFAYYNYNLWWAFGRKLSLANGVLGQSRKKAIRACARQTCETNDNCRDVDYRVKWQNGSARAVKSALAAPTVDFVSIRIQDETCVRYSCG